MEGTFFRRVEKDGGLFKGWMICVSLSLLFASPDSGTKKSEVESNAGERTVKEEIKNKKVVGV